MLLYELRYRNIINANKSINIISFQYIKGIEKCSLKSNKICSVTFVLLKIKIILQYGKFIYTYAIIKIERGVT